MATTTINDLRDLGYDVELAFGDVYAVSGYGVVLYVSGRDGETVARIADPDAHAERVSQFNGNPPTLPPEVEQAAIERAWVELRMKRDRWLAQTDAFFVEPMPSDFPADKAADIDANRAGWATFRQQLRDLPQNTQDPRQVDWPTPPAAPVVYLT